MDAQVGVVVILLLFLFAIIVVVAYQSITMRHDNHHPSPSPPPPHPKSDYLELEDLQSMWNGNGLLNTSFVIPQMCPQYHSENCLDDAQKCEIPDFSDFRVMNDILSGDDTGISCFALDMTLQKKGLAQVAFGPDKISWFSKPGSNEYVIGVFLDLSIMRPYIACMAPLDSGSIVRYGGRGREEEAFKITPTDMKENYDDLVRKCRSDNECGLYMAGCANSNGNLSRDGYYFATTAYDPPIYKGDDNQSFLPRGWSSPGPGSMSLFGQKSMNEFIETTRKIQIIVGAQTDPGARGEGGPCAEARNFTGENPVPKDQTCPDFWSYDWVGNDDAIGFRENEIDVFVPQEKGPKRCNPHSEFVDDFRRAIVGVYAVPYCAKDVAFTKEGAGRCCTSQFSKSLAKAMAHRYNDSAFAKSKHKIYAYFWKSDAPDATWHPDDHDSLQIEKID